jgi:hypothetical protein
MILAAIAIALQSAVPVWQPLGTTAGGLAVSWDSASVERVGESVWARLKTVRPSPEPGTTAYAVSRIEIRCREGTGRVVETVNYLTDGSRGRTDTAPEPFEAIPPTSMLATIQRAVC